MIGGSKIGPHKSDYIFYSKDDFLVSQLSTGQQKTLILLIFLSIHIAEDNGPEPVYFTPNDSKNPWIVPFSPILP